MPRPTRFRPNSYAVKIRAMLDLQPSISAADIAAQIGCSKQNIYQTIHADRHRQVPTTPPVKVVYEKKTTPSIDAVSTPEEEEAFNAIANSQQVGGSHYKDKAIQPWDYIASNGLGYLEGNIVKYVSRWTSKHGDDKAKGLEDLKKAQHYLTKLIEVNS
jgi:hypothetical protein